MTLLDALAHALADGKESKPLLEQAYNRSSDLGIVAKALATGGINAIRSFPSHSWQADQADARRKTLRS